MMNETSPPVFPEPGAQVPDFDMAASHDRHVSLSALRGKPFVLYFYPKANTSGCTKEACGFQEALSELGEEEGITVIGVSRDAMPAIEKFAQAQDLSFPLASDATGAVTEAYGVWIEKSMYGRTYMGMERSSFLVDGQGIIRNVWRKVKPATHAALVAEAFRDLSSGA